MCQKIYTLVGTIPCGYVDYSATPDLAPPEPISGAEAYQLYMEHTLPYLKTSGGEVMCFGTGRHFLIGPTNERWDAVMLVRQKRVGDFLAFAHNAASLPDDIMCGISLTPSHTKRFNPTGYRHVFPPCLANEVGLQWG